MNNLYDLRYDFLQQNGNYLIFWKENGLVIDQLNNIQVKMLLSNFIPKLLPLELEENDFNIKLRYEITSKKTLASYLKMQQLNTNQVFQIFIDIVSIIEDCKLFMLEERNYIIHEDFIFMNNESKDTFFTYLPLKNFSDKDSTQLELKKLYMYLFNDLQDLDRRLYQEIILFFENDYFTISGLKEKLLKSNLPTNLNSSNYCQVTTIQKYDSENIYTQKESIIKEPLKSLTSRQIMLFFSGAILLIALVWRTYLDWYYEGLFYICLGITILIIDSVYIFLKIWRPDFKKRNKKKKIKSCNIDKFVDKTTLLARNDETVMLKKLQKKIYLKVDRGTTIEEIEVDSKNFIIGRNPSTANYVENSRGISRVHIEIIEDSTEYLIRDLGSKNGSYLNDKALIPNKIYPIKDGDVIKLAKTEFTIKEVSII